MSRAHVVLHHDSTSAAPFWEALFRSRREISFSGRYEHIPKPRGLVARLVRLLNTAILSA